MAETRAPAVVDYLARLDDAARLLPPELRAELVGQVREHLAELEASGLDEAGLRTALDRFGTPEQLVAAEAEQAGLVYAPADRALLRVDAPAGREHRPWGGLELSAVLLVLVGGFVVPVVAPLAGIVLAWASPRWGRGTKVGATLLLLSPAVVVGLGALAFLLPTQRTVSVQTSDGPVEVPIPDQVPGETAPYAGDPAFGLGPTLLDQPRLLLVSWLLLVLLTAVGWLGAGLWLALAGRTQRR